MLSALLFVFVFLSLLVLIYASSIPRLCLFIRHQYIFYSLPIKKRCHMEQVSFYRHGVMCSFVSHVPSSLDLHPMLMQCGTLNAQIPQIPR